MKRTKTDSAANARSELLDIFRRRGGLLTRRDMTGLGTASDTLQQVLRDGSVVRVARGIYRLAETVPFGTAAFAEACLAIRSGVVALQSALAYYELTTAIVDVVYLGIPRRVAPARLDIPVKTVQMPMSRFRWGVEQQRDGINRFRIFSRERTICDCFAYPKNVPETIAYEGLRTYLQRSDRNIDALLEHAKFTKTEAIIEPVVRVLEA